MEIEKDLGTEELTIQSLINQVGSEALQFCFLSWLSQPLCRCQLTVMPHLLVLYIFYRLWSLRGQETLQLPNRIASRKLSPSLISFSITNGKIPLKARWFLFDPACKTCTKQNHVSFDGRNHNATSNDDDTTNPPYQHSTKFCDFHHWRLVC